eukprot:COSAG06_NODE_58720_length_276_cov_0.700565_1_plen_55_part_10
MLSQPPSAAGIVWESETPEAGFCEDYSMIATSLLLLAALPYALAADCVQGPNVST